MRKHNLFSAILILTFFNSYSHYQPIIINGIEIEKGSRECESRYEPIKKILDLYNRPITILDIGASEGYYSFKIAKDYDSTCVMIEGNYQTDSQEGTADRLEKLCAKNNTLNNIILLKKHITAKELSILSECEHFDVIIALNVIHHFGPDWKAATDAILDLGDNIIIQTPPKEDKNAAGQKYISKIEQYLMEKYGKIIGNFPRQTQSDVMDKMFWFKSDRDFLKRIHWANSLPKEKWQNYKIVSDFDQKYFLKKHVNEQRPWYHGINLYTFKILNGTWPKNQTITDLINNIDFSNHNDVKIWNLIIQGQKLIANDE